MYSKKRRAAFSFSANVLITVLALTLIASVSNANIVYVDANAAGAETGTSWGDAYSDLQVALVASVAGDSIWVAAGTYYPGDDSLDAFHLKDDVGLFGWFSGWESSFNERSPLNETVLSGDVGVLADSTDNCFHVVIGSGTVASAIIDGFTITGGFARGSLATTDPLGGGMLNQNGSPTVRNIVFCRNAARVGGGLFVEGGISMTSVSFVRNTIVTDHPSSGGLTTGLGAAIYSKNSGTVSLTDALVLENTGATSGYSMYSVLADASLTSVRFEGNTGGGMYIERGTGGLNDVEFEDNTGNAMENNQSTVNIVDCYFLGNERGMLNWVSSPVMGNVVFADNTPNGAIWNTLSNPTIVNASFRGNYEQSNLGHCLRNETGSMPVVVNSILWGEGIGAGGGPYIYDDGSSPATVTYSIVEGGHAGTGNLTADPLFNIDATSPDPAKADLDIWSSSPAVDAGDSTASALTTDIEGEDRVSGNEVDMGAYEAGRTPTSAPVAATATVTRILKAYPNPFNPAVTIEYELDARVFTIVSVYDVTGTEVRRLFEGMRDAGVHSASWDGMSDSGDPVVSGVYVVRLNASGMFRSRKVLLLK